MASRYVLIALLLLVMSTFVGNAQFARRRVTGFRPIPARRMAPANGFVAMNARRGPQRPPMMQSFRPLPIARQVGDHMPGIRPPKGIADKLNKAKLSDFMRLGRFLMQRRRFLVQRQ